MLNESLATLRAARSGSAAVARPVNHSWIHGLPLQDALPPVAALYQRHPADRDRLRGRRAPRDHGHRRRLHHRAGDDLSAAHADQCGDGHLAVPDHRRHRGHDRSAGDQQLCGRHRAGGASDRRRRGRRAVRRARGRQAARRAVAPAAGAAGAGGGAAAAARPGGAARRVYSPSLAARHESGRCLLSRASAVAAPAPATRNLVSGCRRTRSRSPPTTPAPTSSCSAPSSGRRSAAGRDIVVVVRGPGRPT